MIYDVIVDDLKIVVRNSCQYYSFLRKLASDLQIYIYPTVCGVGGVGLNV